MQHWLLIFSKTILNPVQPFCCCCDLKWAITSNIGSERQENMNVIFSQVEEAESFHTFPTTVYFTFSPEWVAHRNVHIITGSPPLDLFGYLLIVMHQMLLEVIKNIYHLQNNSAIEIMIPVAWKENNILLNTNKRQIRIKFLNHVITQDTER